MKTKILSLVLVVAMLASMLVLAPVSGATESKATLEFGNAVGVKGDTVTVDFTVTTEALSSIQFMFEYDASRLTYDGIEWTTAKEHGGAGFPADLSTNPAFIYFTEKGPYSVPNWSTGMNVGAINLEAGGTLATLSFTIKEDAPLGEAYVKFAPLKNPDNANVMVNKVVATNAEDSFGSDDMTFVDGSVTVLPAGYSTVSTLPTPVYLTDADLNYEFNATMTGWIITGKSNNYAAEGVVVFPSSIPDWTVNCDGTEYPVVGIASNAFVADAKATAFVIPETVTEIAPAAFLRCEATDYYVMNDACVIGEGAMCTAGAYSGTAWTSGPFIWDKDFVAGTTVAVTTIHGGANAKAYAEATYKTNAAMKGTGFSYSSDKNLPTDAVLTFNGTEYLFVPGTEVTLPGIMEDANGNLVVAWNAGVVGSTITITEDIVLEPAKTIAKPDMTSTYGFKPTESPATTAMRFTTTLAKADYETFAGVAESLGGRVEMGTLITPARFVSKAGALTKEALDALSASNNNAQTYIDIDTTGKYFSLEDNIYTFAGSVYGFKGTNHTLDYAAAFYMSVVVGEDETEETLFTVYSDFEFANNRQPLAAAKAVYEVATTNAVKDAVLKFIRQYEPTYGEES